MFAFLRVLLYVGVKKIGLVKKVLVLVSVKVLVSLHHIWCICESTLCNMNFKKKCVFVKHPNGHADYYVGKVLCAPRTSLFIIMIILACSSNYKLWCKSQVGEDLQKVILGNPSKTSPATVNICAIFLCHLDGDFTKKSTKPKLPKQKKKQA